MTFAEFITASRERGELAGLDELYLHRAHRVTGGSGLAGRDSIRSALAGQVAPDPEQRVTVDSDLGDVVAVTVAGGGNRASLRSHHWLTLEDSRIAHELVVGDDGTADQGSPWALFRPLGERRAGAGQLAVGEQALLPRDPGSEARKILDGIHALWNGRDFSRVESLYDEEAQWTGPSGQAGGKGDMRSWVLDLLSSLPDSWLLFERIVEHAEQLAILWRLVADEGERRLHLQGSTILTLAGGRIVRDDTLIDEAGLAAQRTQPIIDL